MRAIDNSSRPGSIILEPFGGSGSTLIAAEISGRRARVIELDPAYCDVIARRYQESTGDMPKLNGEDKDMIIDEPEDDNG
jgi:DNA modification methylase